MNHPPNAALKNPVINENQYNFITENPIKTCLFDYTPRHLTQRKDISSSLKVVLGVLYGSLGNDCKLVFRVKTLAKRTGLSESTVKRSIAQGRKLGLFITIETGRALIFKLIDNQDNIKVIHQVAQNDLSHYKQQKKEIKQTTNQNLPERKPPKKPPEKSPSGLVVDIFKIRKLIHPKIGLTLSDETIRKKCAGKTDAIIKKASELANKPGIANKAGYFLKMLEVDMYVSDELQEVPLLTVKPGQKESWDTIQLRSEINKILTCYNHSVHKPCTVMKDTGKPTQNCIKYCPYLNRKRS